MHARELRSQQACIQIAESGKAFTCRCKSCERKYGQWRHWSSTILP